MLIGSPFVLQFYNSETTIVSRKIQGIVSGNVEVSDARDYQVSGRTLVDSSIDISDDGLRFTVESGSGTFNASSSSFRGFRFSDESNAVPRIIGVDIVSDTARSFTPDQIHFSDNFVSFDLSNDRYLPGYTIDVEFIFEESFSGRPSEGVIDRGGAAGSVFRGTSGSDTFQFDGSGQNSFRGGQGLDVVKVDGAAWNYRVYIADSINAYVSEINPNASAPSTVQVGARNSLTDVERVDFSNGTLALDIGYAEHAGTAYRTYQAAFGREPDLQGLGFHVRNLDNGYTFADMANGFVNSPEFKALYGDNVSNAAYVDLLYRNVLGRAGDTEGTTYWNGLLDSGRANKNDVLIGFADSPENISLVQTDTAHGIWYI